MNKKKFLLIIIVILLISVVTFGGTFAYLSWISSNDQKTMVTFATSHNFSCSADGGGNITSSNVSLAPTNCTDSEHAIKRTVTVSPTISGGSNIYLDLWLKVNSIDLGLSNSSNFKYALTTGSNSCTDGVVNSGNFNGAGVGTHKKLLENIQYSTTTTSTYYLWIWLDEAETSASTMNQNFNISLSGACGMEQFPPIATIPSQIAQNVAMDNTTSAYVTNTNGVQFNAISSDTNGKGIYLKSDTENDPNPVYYYRGAVTNNNVLFNNFCWKIVRTTDTGGIKLIYNGISSNGKCNNTTGTATQLETTSNFNDKTMSQAYVGYMYGNVYPITHNEMTNITDVYKYGKTFTYSNGSYTLSSTGIKSFAGTDWASNYNQLNNNHYTCLNTTGTCSQLFYLVYTNNSSVDYITLTGGKSVEDAISEMFINSSNTTNSAIKTVIDSWYSSNMTGYTDKLEDTVWCNDKSIYNLNGWDPNGGDTTKVLQFWPFTRINTYVPSMGCNKNDAFTMNNVTTGNGKLTYPVGLLTADEIMVAGGTKETANSTFYLYTYSFYWTGSPTGGSNQNGYVYGVDYEGKIISTWAAAILGGVRPAVSLKPGTVFTLGDGTANSPYTNSEWNR